MAMRAGNGWKTLVRKGRHPVLVNDQEDGPELGIGGQNDPTSVLLAQKDDIIAIWKNPAVQAVLARRRPTLQNSPGLFESALLYRRFTLTSS